MKGKKLHQTLENRENPDEVEKSGPFRCNWQNTWLGEGYYFWDTFIENAHWWGEVRYNDNYIICEAQCDFDSSTCFDLVGDTDHMNDFNISLNFLKDQRLIDNKTSFARIFNFIRVKIPDFKFQAVRVYGIKSISDYNENYAKFRHRVMFEPNKPQYLDYKPPIQICIFEKKGLNLRNFKIVYPEEYMEDYVV
ncbi:hypothetical protein Dfri01_01940 [Dyadobacter frigoris]|uniref:hypothetical protein n=1 Tax=Dyadobacter frigoris TaxID=2576211 RepID=UPI0024A20565|nr:hypothetical protein [Dyadobacter frigoris]GLU50733.1 hypothetical protein Dfri01_01940 [Dyadobacter frigoris]